MLDDPRNYPFSPTFLLITAPSSPKQFALDNEHPDRGLRIKWETPQCDGKSGYVAKYRIKMYKCVKDANSTGKAKISMEIDGNEWE